MRHTAATGNICGVTMGIESLTPFLLTDIPGDVALLVGPPIAGALVTAIVGLWRRVVTLEDRTQANIERAAASAYATADAINKLTDALEGNRRRARTP
jgi:hypothetical protein